MILKFVFLLSTFQLFSCSGVNNTRYKDTSNLEKPPTMKIVQRPEVEVKENEEIKKTGFAKDVSVSGTNKKSVMKIKKLFDRSWSLVEQAIKLKEIQITDKNRDQGVFYVLYDPDTQSSNDDADIIEKVAFFFKDKFEEAAYKLTLIWRENNTEVSVELVDQADNSLLDDDEDQEDFAGSVDDGGMLLNEIYRTIRDDLPND